MAILQWQVQEFQSRAEENQAASNRIAKLEAELQEIVAWRREMFTEGQDLIKKELMKWFPTENFAWIGGIFPDEENNKDNDG